MTATLRVTLVVALTFAMLGVTTVRARTPVAQLEQQRISAAQKAFAAARAAWQQGRGTLDAVYQWSVRWLDAERDRPIKRPMRIAAVSRHLDRMKKLQAAVTQKVQTGMATPLQASAASYYRAEAEVWQARALRSR